MDYICSSVFIGEVLDFSKRGEYSVKTHYSVHFHHNLDAYFVVVHYCKAQCVCTLRLSQVFFLTF